MKYLIASLFLFIGSLYVQAGTGSFSVTTDDDNYVILNLDQESGMQVGIEIFDPTGNKIFNEVLLSDKIIRRKYDFRILEEGKYTMQVEFSNVINIYQINKSKKAVKLFGSQTEQAFKPNIKSAKNLVDLNMLCFAGKFEVAIFDRFGETVYFEEREATGAFHSRYDLSSLPEGRYIFKVNLKQPNYSGSFEEIVYKDYELVNLEN